MSIQRWNSPFELENLLSFVYAAFYLGFTLLRTLLLEATHRSYPLCNPIQNRAEFPKYRLSRSAVSAVIPRFPRTKSLTRGIEICRSLASRHAVKSSAP